MFVESKCKLILCNKMLFDEYDINTAMSVVIIYFNRNITTLIIEYLIATSEHFEELIRQKFCVCIQGFRYTFSFLDDYYELAMPNLATNELSQELIQKKRCYVQGFRYTFSFFDCDFKFVVLNLGYSNPHENKRRNRKPYSRNQDFEHVYFSFQDLWLFVLNVHPLFFAQTKGDNIELQNIHIALQNIIRKRMKFRFLNGGKIKNI